VVSVLALVFVACEGQDKMQPKVPETTSAEAHGTKTDETGSPARSQPNTEPQSYTMGTGTDQSAQPVPQPNMQGGSVMQSSGTPGNSMMQSPATGTPTGGGTMTTSDMTDDQILQMVHVANTGEVDQAKLAQAKAKSARVKQFAAMMVHDHSQADAQGYDIARRLKITLADSAEANQLQNSGQQTLVQLRSEGSASFDRAYLDAQISEHQTVLNTIDSKLLPNAKSTDVRSHLQAVRAKVESHLREAQSIQGSLK